MCTNTSAREWPFCYCKQQKGKVKWKRKVKSNMKFMHQGDSTGSMFCLLWTWPWLVPWHYIWSLKQHQQWSWRVWNQPWAPLVVVLKKQVNAYKYKLEIRMNVIKRCNKNGVASQWVKFYFKKERICGQSWYIGGKEFTLQSSKGVQSLILHMFFLNLFRSWYVSLEVGPSPEHLLTGTQKPKHHFFPPKGVTILVHLKIS